MLAHFASCLLSPFHIHCGSILPVFCLFVLYVCCIASHCFGVRLGGALIRDIARICFFDHNLLKKNVPFEKRQLLFLIQWGHAIYLGYFNSYFAFLTRQIRGNVGNTKHLTPLGGTLVGPLEASVDPSQGQTWQPEVTRVPQHQWSFFQN